MIAPVLALAAVTLAPLALGQKIVWQRDGVEGQHRFTGIARAIGDVDGDGWDDIAAFVNLRGGVWGEQIWFLSGRDGRTLRVRREFRPSWMYLNIARAGDMNGDGIPDYVLVARLSSGTRPLVEVASGADDTTIWRVEKSSLGFGMALLGDLDIDGDRRPDILVTDPVDFSNIRIHAYDNTGRLLYVVHRPPDMIEIGARNPETIEWLGDVDNDGADDYLIGTQATTGASGALVISGRTGQIVLRALSSRFAGKEIFGDQVAGTDDLDGDGVRDLLAGSIGIPGALMLFSGATGVEIRHWPNPVPGNSGFVSALAACDLDRDGVRDALVGAAALLDARILAYSGRDGRVLLDIAAGRQIGTMVDLVRGPANDPFPLFITTMPTYRPQSDGRVALYRAKPATVTLPGAPPCQGFLPTPAEIGVRNLTAGGLRGVRVHLSEAPRGVGAWLFLGLSNTSWNGVPLPYDLSFLGLPAGCALHTSIDAVAVRVTGSSGLDAGFAYVDLPFELSAIGTRIWAQWALFGPGNTWPGGLTRPLSWQLAL